jgi:hypothetical protein
LLLINNIAKSITKVTLGLVVIVFSSCSPARYVPEGNYLLSKNRLETEQKKVSDEQLKSYIIQKPNKKVLCATKKNKQRKKMQVNACGIL